MKFLLQKKRSGNTVASGNSSAGYVAPFYIRLQTVLVKWIKTNTESFSRWNWILLLIIFVVIACGYSTYMLLNIYSDEGKKSFVVTPIRKPAYLTKTGDVKVKDLSESKAEYQRIHIFRMYMDSLAGSPTGKVIYDRIIRRRPGLMDSIRYIDKDFSHLKNE